MLLQRGVLPPNANEKHRAPDRASSPATTIDLSFIDREAPARKHADPAQQRKTLLKQSLEKLLENRAQLRSAFDSLSLPARRGVVSIQALRQLLCLPKLGLIDHSIIDELIPADSNEIGNRSVEFQRRKVVCDVTFPRRRVQSVPVLAIRIAAGAVSFYPASSKRVQDIAVCSLLHF